MEHRTLHGGVVNSTKIEFNSELCLYKEHIVFTKLKYYSREFLLN